jgi:hypothetical protein
VVVTIFNLFWWNWLSNRGDMMVSSRSMARKCYIYICIYNIHRMYVYMYININVLQIRSFPFYECSVLAQPPWYVIHVHVVRVTCNAWLVGWSWRVLDIVIYNLYIIYVCWLGLSFLVSRQDYWQFCEMESGKGKARCHTRTRTIIVYETNLLNLGLVTCHAT